jgi:predicted O-linked N-acetylglucosamine transferase (SPINDLY family)
VNGYVTFGSFNNLPKITPNVVALWSKILDAVPQSRLLIKNRSLADAQTRDHYEELFARHGIGAERLALTGWTPKLEDHLGLYHQIDLALDTFPYHGTTTTCEALWMGVPVVTLAGRTHAARVGVSLLSQLNLPELIARDEDDYVRIAVALAQDRERLTALRGELRPRMAQSPLCDAAAFTRDVEAAYREMWRGWCGTRTSV